MESIVRDGSIDGDTGWRGARAPHGFFMTRGLVQSSCTVHEAAHGGSRLVVHVHLPTGVWTTRIVLPLAFLLVVATTAAIAAVRRDGTILVLLAMLPWIEPWSTLRQFWTEARRAEESLRRSFPPPALATHSPFR